MIRKTMVLAVFLGILVLGAGNLRGEVLTINITAEITYLDDDYNLLMGSLNVGDILTGSYTYNSTTPDSEPSNNKWGVYRYYSIPYGIILEGGGFVFQTDPANVDFCLDVINNYEGASGYEDYYAVGSSNNLPLYEGVSVDRLEWGLRDYSGTAISSDALLTTAPVLSDWPDERMYGLEVTGLRLPLTLKEDFMIRANVTSAVLIPEPASALMLAIGAALIRCRRKSC